VTTKTYALLIYQVGAEPSAESSARTLDRHRALQAEASASGELHEVARLATPATAKTVAVRGDAHEITDGPYAETKEWLVGFYIVDCATEVEAIRRARTICPEANHVIEVRPVAWRWKG
jgi:hypothetical protein